MASKKVEVLPLTEGEYTVAFKTFCSSTTQYERMLELIKPVVESLKGKSIDFMSIGAGTGCFENDLVTNLGLRVSYLLAIEPNEEHHKLLKQRIISWENAKFTADRSYFTENYEVEDKFDLVLMSHCVYSMANVEEVLLKATSLLKAEGKLVIFVHSETGSELISKSMGSVQYLSKPLSDETLTNKYFCDILTKNSIKFTSSEAQTVKDVTDFVKQNDTPTANDVVSFLIQTRFEKLPEELRKELYEMVRDRVIHSENNMYLLPNPTAMIIVEQKF